ncbi:Hypothetical protein AJAP_09010 [Amycolatopsis japonica]|uniref:Uncharacterized protein n=1 Tax=Amycolatopsis japonica TaxID=208439 RepID=A0A075UQT4_9PSEU|nr:Hypothetical protein AJAP_09010 [Amycolatopsis japonica]
MKAPLRDPGSLEVPLTHREAPKLAASESLLQEPSVKASLPTLKVVKEAFTTFRSATLCPISTSSHNGRA